MRPERSATEVRLAEGVLALAPGFALLTDSHTLLCADVHLAYEDVVGGALPLWSTAESIATIAIAAQRYAVAEIVFLGDAIHGSRMSEGAAREVIAALASLRAIAALTFVAGNHEGATRGHAILGATVETCERDGWTLLHGDKPPPLGARSLIGHLHPSLHLGGGTTAPCFLASDRLVVVPALTPYSRGLDVMSDACRDALLPWDIRSRDLTVVAAAGERLYPFGALSALRGVLANPTRSPGSYRRRHIRPDR